MTKPKSTKSRPPEPPGEDIVIELNDSDFVYDGSQSQTTATFDMRGFLGPEDDKTPVRSPDEECPFCLRRVKFYWQRGTYRFAAHGEPVPTSVYGEMPSGEDCPGSGRPVEMPIRPTRHVQFLRPPVIQS